MGPGDKVGRGRCLHPSLVHFSAGTRQSGKGHPGAAVVQIDVSQGIFRTLTSGTPAAAPDAPPVTEPAGNRSAQLAVTAGAGGPLIVSDAPRGARGRASFPTLDAVSGVPLHTPLTTSIGGQGLLTELPDGVLGVTAEHRGRYVAEPDGELGRGGIGRVYIAADRHLGREVAIKELLIDRALSERPDALGVLARFLREARITGKLEHPNIVPVHELGRRADGSLYYSMRVVRGRTLSQALAGTSTLAERLRLLDHFIGLCQAIAYAHSRGVVHRDIKPDNVMIGEFGETVVLDWGMAKAHGSEPGDDSRDGASFEPVEPLGLDLTIEGSLCGTPTHMSPEQARGASDEVDERSDVWALGVVLYTMLTGRTPFEARTLPELIRRIRSGVHPPPQTVDPEIPAELSAIAERALKRDVAARYPSAREVLRDVEAYRSGAQVGAYEYSTLELLRRFLERHRTAAVASAVGLCVALVLAVASYVRLAAARDRAREAERRATQNEQEARESERSAKDSLSLVLVEKAEQAIGEGDRTGGELLAAVALRMGERSDARGLALAAESAFRPEPEFTLGAAAGCTRYALGFAAGLVACARTDGVSVYGVRDGALRMAALPGASLNALELSADGTLLLTVRDDGDLVLYDLEDRGRALLERRVGQITAAAISSDGKYLAWGGAQGQVSAWDVGSPGREWRYSAGQGVSALSFSPENGSLVVGGDLGLVTLWDFRTHHARPLTGHTGTVRAFAFAQQGRYLASGAADRTIRFWDTRDALAVSSPLVHSDVVTSLSWTADGRLLAFGSKDKTLHVVDLKDAERRAEVRFHDDSVDHVGLAADGNELASVSRELGLELWSLASMKRPSALVAHGNVLSFAFVPGTSDLVAAGLGSEGVGIFGLDTGVRQTRLPAGIERVRTLAVSEDGKYLAFAGSGARVFLWDLPARMPLTVFDSPRDEVRAVTFSRDGRWLAFAGLDHVLRVANAATFETVAELDGGAPVQALAFSPTTNLLAAGDRDGMLSIWDVAQKKRLSRVQAHDDWLLSVALSPDGSRIATAGADRRVKLWDAASGVLTAELAGHEGKVLSVIFSPDGRLLASGAEDKSVRLWDVQTGHEAAVLTGHTGAVRAVRFAPDRALLASAGDDGSIRLWQLATLHDSGAALAQRVQARYGVELVGTRVARRREP